MTELAVLRARLEAVDDALVDALVARAELVGEIWALKDRLGVARIDPAREAAELERLVARAPELDRDVLFEVLGRIVGRDLRAAR